MEVEFGKHHPDNPPFSFQGQECPWVQPVAEGGVLLTYYESNPGVIAGQPVAQRRVTLRLSKHEREKLKGLL